MALKFKENLTAYSAEILLLGIAHAGRENLSVTQGKMKES